MSNPDNFLFGTGTVEPVTGQRPLSVLPLQNFLGGINLARGDTQLFDNESGDLCNIDILEAGGFCRRSPVRAHTREDLPSEICDVALFQSEDGEPVMYIVLVDGTVWTVEGTAVADATPVLTGITVPTDCQSIQIGFNQYFYGPGSDATVVTPEGDSSTVPWQTIDAVAGFSTDCKGDLIALGCDDEGGETEIDFVFGFPQAECMAIHADFAWAANVVDPNDPTVRHCNRVYRSFPLTGDNATGQVWSSSEYIDIDQGDGDCITNIISCGPNLYVFKNNSVYIIQGWDAAAGDQIVSVKLCGDAGTPSCRTAVCCNCELYFWDAARGLYRINGTQVEWVFEKLWPLLRDGCIRRCEPAIGCCNGRIFVSVSERPVVPEDEEAFDLEPDCTNNTTYVLSPETETWVKHTYGVVCYVDFRPRTGIARCLAVSSRNGVFSMIEIERPGAKALLDRFNVAGGEENIVSYWRSKWFDGGNPFTEKEWCRPQILAQSTNVDWELDIKYLGDWCLDNVTGAQVIPFFQELAEDFEPDEPQFEIPYPGAEPVEVCPPSTDTGVTDRTCPISNFKKEKRDGPAIDDSCSVQMLVTGPPDKDWCVCALLLAYTESELCCG